jgi:hypothetical protein
MTSILKVDTIQDTAGNNIINESSDTITIGASGDTITIPSGATISNLGTASGFGVNTPAFEAYLSATQTTTHSTDTIIQFNTEVIDTDSAYDTGTYRFTPQVAGKYFIYSNLTTGSSSASQQELLRTEIWLNGSMYRRVQIDPYGGSRAENVSASAQAILDLNGTTDYVQINGLSQVGGGTPGFFGGEKYCYFGAYRLIGV